MRTSSPTKSMALHCFLELASWWSKRRSPQPSFYADFRPLFRPVDRRLRRIPFEAFPTTMISNDQSSRDAAVASADQIGKIICHIGV
jgi:hypothetical protein